MLARSDAAYLATERCDLAELTREALERLAPEADERELALDLSLEPAEIDGDRALLERLVGNLVENAVRHNIDGGWIALSTSRDGDRVQLRVANAGTMLHASQVNMLFDRFRRADDARDRGTPGFGLGLSIVESVVRAHRGTVRAEPVPEGGLLVTVELPGAPTPRARSRPPDRAEVPGAGISLR